ncbi:MAG TPA: hypothetical protein VF070_07330 [Streptosporangiaceae bacterium]
MRMVDSRRLAGRGWGGPPSGRRGGRRARKQGRSARLRGLRWVPVPLALLAAVLGLLVAGSLQGRAAAGLASEPNQAGGLGLHVDTMVWMSNDMGGNGAPQAAPAPADSPNGYTMPDSMMPGMQPTGDDRLRVEVDLSNVTNAAQQYATTDFSLSGPGGKTFHVNGQEHSAQPASADLQPGFRTTIDLYFDLPDSEAKNLTLHWSHGGRTISMPVTTSSEPGSMHM